MSSLQKFRSGFIGFVEWLVSDVGSPGADDLKPFGLVSGCWLRFVEEAGELVFDVKAPDGSRLQVAAKTPRQVAVLLWQVLFGVPESFLDTATLSYVEGLRGTQEKEK